MIYWVHFPPDGFVNVEASTPEQAACIAIENRERWSNEYTVGCGGEERAVYVSTPTGRITVIVSGRMVPTYAAERVR